MSYWRGLRTMKKSLLIWGGVIILALRANAAITIPDGNAVGVTDTRTISGLGASITDVRVTLDISGGYNGDLYAYLSYGGVLVPLLNRVGVQAGNAFGYGTTGMSVTLAGNPTGGYANIHGIENPASGNTYAPDGRAIDPQSSSSAFDSAGTIGFTAFNGKDPNGTWTLFFADMSSGAQSTLASWNLVITAVPEPTNVALAVFSGVVALVAIGRSKPVRNTLRRFSA
jgi:subtilisin-like proprotein convertase family protein